MSDTSRKGHIVEQIVAKLHETPNILIETRAMLTPLVGKGRKREIDILISTDVAGYPVRIAVECKNEARPILETAIDAFFGKLTDIGIPTQYGIFVSTSRYTQGAERRAKAAGIKLLRLSGLTADRLSAAVMTAFQSVIHLFMSVRSVVIEYHSKANSPPNAAFVNESGKLMGTLFDVIWASWISGRISGDLGNHDTRVAVPEGWGQIVDGLFERIEEIEASISVCALVFTYKGQVIQHALVETGSNQPDKWSLDAKFDRETGPIALTQITSEDDLQEHIRSDPGICMTTGRFILPRIGAYCRFGKMLWPPSEKSAARMKQAAEFLMAGNDLDDDFFNGEPVDDSNVNTILDPIWSGWPSPFKSPEPREQRVHTVCNT